MQLTPRDGLQVSAGPSIFNQLRAAQLIRVLDGPTKEHEPEGAKEAPLPNGILRLETPRQVDPLFVSRSYRGEALPCRRGQGAG